MNWGVEVEGLRKTFRGDKEVVAVDGLSFRVGMGEVYALLGANGAGKTTTLRMLSTLMVPNEGTIRVAGHDVRTAPAAARASIGFLSPSMALHERLTVRESLRYFAHLQGVRDVRTRVDALVERFDLTDYADRTCDHLSTGMGQKAQLARAFLHDPPVLVLDEPTNGLDVLVTANFRDHIRQARDAGKAVLLSTHIMREVEEVSDRVGILHGGRLIAEGTVAELLDRTRTTDLERAFVALVGGA